MKIKYLQKSLAMAVVIFLAMNLVAQDSATTATTVASTTGGNQAAPQLSYGVPQILQLAQAKVGDDTIVAYIKNSGTIYSLDASQIVYLRQQGVSDRVVTTMLDQRNNVPTSTAQTATETPAPAQNYAAASAQASTAVAQPTVTYVQTIPSSSVYVIPDTQTYNYDAYYYQPYYYPYYAWPYPAVSLSFGFGGRWGGGGFHGGGFHGGGGGWHHH